MASLEPYEIDGYSDEEEEDWPDQQGTVVESVACWNKDHKVRNSELSELVAVGEFKALCKERVYPVRDGSYGRKNFAINRVMARELGMTVAELKKIQLVCSPKKLLPAGGYASLSKLENSRITSETSFKSLSRDHKELRKLFHKNPSTYGYDLKARENEERTGEKQVPVGEVVLCVTVFHPITKNRDQEYATLASQPLTKLRDRIVCHNDYFVSKDFSENPSSYKDYFQSLPNPPNPSASAFFFINNTFYNDMRHPDSVDLSKPIIEWASDKERQEHSRRLDHFTAKDMSQTNFEHLSLRLGYPYLYSHHQDCEHIIIFTDMRLFHPSTDKRCLSEYPRLTHRHRKKVIKCKMCRSMEPRWATFNDDLAPCSPCHFCEDCFMMLHYSVDGEKLANFEAYPFDPASH